MSVRRRAREIALQVLYQLDIRPGEPQEALDLYFENFRPSEKAREFCQRLIDGVYQNREEIDRLLEENAENWTLKRMAVVDRNILRVATFELLATPAVPPAVVINEAIEIARRFGTEESSVFVNGVLDQIATELGVKPTETATTPVADE